MFGDIPRKRFGRPADVQAATRTERFIASRTDGAGTWQDGDTVEVPTVRGGMLVVRDKVGTDDGGPLRHIELHLNGKRLVTFEYNHHQRQLVRTF